MWRGPPLHPLPCVPPGLAPPSSFAPLVIPQPTSAPTHPLTRMHTPLQAPCNALAWAPHSACHICTAGDDSQALIWDLSAMGGGMGQPGEAQLDPILAYNAGAAGAGPAQVGQSKPGLGGVRGVYSMHVRQGGWG